MKTLYNTFKKIAFLVIVMQCALVFGQFAPIVPNATPQTDSCGVTDGAFDISVPTEALSGANILLNITLPGTFASSCDVELSIDYSNSLSFVTSTDVDFTPNAGTLNTTSPLPGNDGRNFNVIFKFPSFVTCDGTVGTFTVTATGCDGEVCTTSVDVIARAENYWTIEKEFANGDLSCGVSSWRFKILSNNPNPDGQGTYSIQGAITETTSLPVVNNPVINFNGIHSISYQYNNIQNCQDPGTIITNTADYSYTLGNGCEIVTNSITADSPILQAPNPSMDFTKKAFANTGGVNTGGTLPIPPGCEGSYSIQVNNNGNVPWTNIVVTDDFNIPGITVTGVNLPSSFGWQASPAISPIQATNYTFSLPSGYVLNPGDYAYFKVYYTVNANATIGNIIPNTAYLNYQAPGASSNTGGSASTQNVCAGVNCPSVDATLQNDTATVNIEVAQPESQPSIAKCIVNAPPGNIYQLGDLVTFRVLVGNNGAANLTTIVTDALGMPNQNLQIVPGSINYTYYADSQYSTNACWVNLNAPDPLSFPITANTTDLQNPTFDIANMPGNCNYNITNYLEIVFDAQVLPQLYGNKVNTASLTQGQSDSVSYTIDQSGVLEIDKIADAQIVEDGQNFNYILTVTNSGTVPLDHIVITDSLPDCVNTSGSIEITDALGSSVSSTTSGSLTISVNPSAQLLPGDDMIITIPVTKTGSGSCCNITASVIATMTTSGVDLYAIDDGNASAPAACVVGTECCDISDFDASITSSNGNYNLQITGGATPLQEVEISMVDYHVTYSDDACAPSDLGNFGTLTTLDANLNGLLLNAADNGTSSLTWLAGNPSVINSAVNLNIINPEVLNLECCDTSFYFCLKIRVKDVNCNVCEITVCYSSEEDIIDEPEPCSMVPLPLSSNGYCVGDAITFDWTSSNGSGLVDVLLVDGANTSVQFLATGIPDVGSYSYTIPQGFSCDDGTQWTFLVRDNDQDLYGDCNIKSSRFSVKCCTVDCGCGKWLSHSVQISAKYKKMILSELPMLTSVSCGKLVTLSARKIRHTFNAPTYVCNPGKCEVDYVWEVTNVQTGQTITHTGTSYSPINPIAGTMFNYKITPVCNGKSCPPCEFKVRYEK